jgi:hypothetical protein
MSASLAPECNEVKECVYFDFSHPCLFLYPTVCGREVFASRGGKKGKLC